MFIGNLTVQWQESVFNKKQRDSVFLLFIFLGTNHWSTLFFCVFANCLQMKKYFVLGYSYENELCNY